jgi:hypothetical protein
MLNDRLIGAARLSPRCVWLVLALLLAGCATPRQPEPTAVAWRDLGTSRPERAQIQRLRDRIDRELPRLLRELRAEDPITRRRAAYVLERVGPTARDGAAAAVLDACAAEDDLVTRAFMIRALAGLGRPQPEAVTFLRRLFYRIDEPVLHAYAAGAIVRLNGVSASEDEIQILLECMNPRQAPGGDAARQYWEGCWAASYMTAMLGREAAPMVPALESVSEAENVPRWVNKQVWFTLRAAARTR